MDPSPEPSAAARERFAGARGPTGELPEPCAALLDAPALVVLRRVGGRETLACSADCLARTAGPEDAAARVIVKRTRSRSWTSALRPARCAAEVEHDNLVALARDGLPVPASFGWQRRGAQSAVAMELVEHAQTLRERIGDCAPGERRCWARALVEIVVRLHAKGWHHRDLYLQHVVLAPRGLVLLDVGRAARIEHDWRSSLGAAAAERWFVKDLAALLHSTPRSVSARERLRFALEYLDGRGVVGRARRRRFIGRVVAKELRMRAHRPRAGEERPWRDR